MRFFSAAIALLLLIGAGETRAVEQAVRFIACPIYRDTDAGPKSGCWLADDPELGERFDISESPVKPDWNVAVLVEGVRAVHTVDACGGTVLAPVRVSVLRDRHCTRAMLPAESFAGHKFVRPARLIPPLYAPPESFPHPFAPRRFEVPFTFNEAFLTYQEGDYVMHEAVTYARATHARSVIITGWAATQAVTVSGEALRERPEVAEERAALASRWMRELRVPAGILHVTWHGDPAPLGFEANEGMLAGSGRRVDITVVPGGA